MDITIKTIFDNWASLSSFDGTNWLKLDLSSSIVSIPEDCEIVVGLYEQGTGEEEDGDPYYRHNYLNSDNTIITTPYDSTNIYGIYYRKLVYITPTSIPTLSTSCLYTKDEVEQGLKYTSLPSFVGCQEKSWSSVPYYGTTMTPGNSYIIFKTSNGYYAFQTSNGSYNKYYGDTSEVSIVGYWTIINNMTTTTTSFSSTSTINENLVNIIYNSFFELSNDHPTDCFAVISERVSSADYSYYFYYISSGGYVEDVEDVDHYLTVRYFRNIREWNSSTLSTYAVSIGDSNQLKGYVQLDQPDISDITEDTLLKLIKNGTSYYLYYTTDDIWNLTSGRDYQALYRCKLAPQGFSNNKSSWVSYYSYQNNKWQLYSWLNVNSVIFSDSTNYSEDTDFDYIKIDGKYYDNTYRDSSWVGKTVTYLMNIEKSYRYQNETLTVDSNTPLEKTSIINAKDFNNLGKSATSYNYKLFSSDKVATNSNYGVKENSNSVLFQGLYSKEKLTDGSYYFDKNSSLYKDYWNKKLNFTKENSYVFKWEDLGFDTSEIYKYNGRYIYWLTKDQLVPIFDCYYFGNQLEIAFATKTVDASISMRECGENSYKNLSEGPSYLSSFATTLPEKLIPWRVLSTLNNPDVNNSYGLVSMDMTSYYGKINYHSDNDSPNYYEYVSSGTSEDDVKLRLNNQVGSNVPDDTTISKKTEDPLVELKITEKSISSAITFYTQFCPKTPITNLNFTASPSWISDLYSFITTDKNVDISLGATQIGDQTHGGYDLKTQSVYQKSIKTRCIITSSSALSEQNLKDSCQFQLNYGCSDSYGWYDIYTFSQFLCYFKLSDDNTFWYGFIPNSNSITTETFTGYNNQKCTCSYTQTYALPENYGGYNVYNKSLAGVRLSQRYSAETEFSNSVKQYGIDYPEIYIKISQ